jgi:hypothetical protein
MSTEFLPWNAAGSDGHSALFRQGACWSIGSGDGLKRDHPKGMHLAFPKSSYTAMIAVLLPELCVDVLSSGNEFVTMSRRALGNSFERAIFSLMRLNAFDRVVTAWAP